MQEGAAQKMAAAAARRPDGELRQESRVDRGRRRAATRAPAAAPGLEFPRFFTEAGVDPFDEVEWELRVGRDRQRAGRGRLRAARRRDSEVLVAAGDQHRRLEVLPRPDRHAGARAQRQAADRPRRRHHHRVGAASRTTSPATRTLQAFSDELKHILVYQKAAFNSPVWFNCGFEKAPQCSACFINSVAGHDGLDPDAGQDRGDALQVRLGHRHATCRRSARRRSCWPAAAPRRGRCRS